VDDLEAGLTEMMLWMSLLGSWSRAQAWLVEAVALEVLELGQVGLLGVMTAAGVERPGGQVGESGMVVTVMIAGVADVGAGAGNLDLDVLGKSLVLGGTLGPLDLDCREWLKVVGGKENNWVLG
jgi:hypothetical protein